MANNPDKTKCPYCHTPLDPHYKQRDWVEHVAQCAINQKMVQITISISTGEKSTDRVIEGADMWKVKQKLEALLNFIEADWEI